MKIGAHYKGEGICDIEKLKVKVLSPTEKNVLMEKDKAGYWRAVVDEVFPGSLYFYELEKDRTRPDPASHFQLQGVHGPLQAIDHKAFSWEDDHWKGMPLYEMLMYELHVGTFTNEGTFKAIIPRLKDIKALGVNAIEIMPVFQLNSKRYLRDFQ